MLRPFYLSVAFLSFSTMPRKLHFLCYLAGVSVANAFTIVTSNSAPVLGAGVVGAGGLLLTGSSFAGGTSSSGTFVNGPLNLDNGTILTTGLAQSAIPGSTVLSTINNVPGSALCTSTLGSASTFDAAVLTLSVTLPVGFQGITANFIFATAEYPK